MKGAERVLCPLLLDHLILLDKKNQILGGYMICTEMFGNGARIALNETTLMCRQMALQITIIMKLEKFNEAVLMELYQLVVVQLIESTSSSKFDT